MENFILTKKAGIGACMDVSSAHKRVYAIQNTAKQRGGRLCVLSPDGTLLSEYRGIGNARQIGISGNLAVISAREDGIRIFDIAGEKPVLLSHFQTVEYATGVTLYANFALISCRQYGVEIIDLSDPRVPRHIGLIRIGEVQSACVYNGYLYGGIWGEMQVAVVDIRDISSPRLVTRIPLEGRGDGVVVRDGILFAVTGQHARGIRNVCDENDEKYGMGNGVQAFDVSDPEHPTPLGSVHCEKRYAVQFDTWKPYLCGDMLLFSLSTLGVYAYRKDGPLFHLALPDVNGEYDAATGLAVCDGRLFVAGGRSDLYVFDQYPFRDTYRYDIAGQLPAAPERFRCTSSGAATLLQRFVPDDAPVLDMCDGGEFYALACGGGGLRLVAQNDFREIANVRTEGFCCDVKYANGRIFAAESDGGLAIYDTSLRLLSRTKAPAPVLQIMLSADARFAVCGCDTKEVLLLDVGDAAAPVLVSERNAAKGPLYGGNFASHTLRDGTMLMFWHRDGLVYTNPSAGDKEFHCLFFGKHNGFMGLGPENGCDTDGEHIFYNLGGGYVLLPMKENIFADDLPLYKSDAPIRGKLTICGGLLVSAERAKGLVGVTDISTLTKPRAVCTISTNASPGKAVAAGQRIFLPAGYGGLLELRL